MTDENRMDELIRAASTNYNLPPATPRDDMWVAIEAARHERKLTLLSPRIASAAPRSARRFAPWSMAAAATLLAIAGVGIGRLSIDRGNSQDAVVTRAGSQIVAQQDTPAALTDAESTATVGGGTDAGMDVVPASIDAPVAAPLTRSVRAIDRAGNGRSRSAVARTFSPLQAELPGRSDGATPRRSIPGSQSTVPYQMATIRHLTEAEAMLTSFALESKDQRTNSQLAGWAKGLLANTRLLLDSPAGDDARRARLLEDLELVLAQIVQLSPAAAAQERDLIDGNIRNGAVMTRLRTAIPAGQPGAF